MHIKSLATQIFKGNLTYPLDIFPEDKTKKEDSQLPFKNYHPDLITKLLSENNYEILETRSVSNIRNEFLKKYLPKEFLIFLESISQKILAKVNFGPSIFILARKK
jgi:hypothetical protein